MVDKTALFRIGYGLYVVTSKGAKDNGLIVNSVIQLADNPLTVGVCINKNNLSHDIICYTKKMNVNCLDEKTPFSVFENFGFKSGLNHDKFEGKEVVRSDNGLIYLPDYANAFFSLEVDDYIDLKSHGMFICSLTEASILSDVPTMTYNYYQANVKPRPNNDKKGYVCSVCGYRYDKDTIPDDFVCPLCKHDKSFFEKIN